MESVNQVLFQREDIQRALTRMTHEILESERDSKELVLVGIQTRGAQLVQRIADQIGNLSGRVPPVGTIDVTPYRDDRKGSGKAEAVSEPFPISIDDKTLVLVDDVIYTGRTIRAALDLVFQMGKPKKVLVAVLVDRGHRELPIKADIIGKNVRVPGTARVNVLLSESDGVDQVMVIEQQRQNLQAGNRR